jgi:hypothetical protein
MESATGAASHKPFTTQVTGGVTVYVETSAQSVSSMEVITRRQLTHRDCGRVGQISGTPAGHPSTSDTPIR